jgi:hypothetical protein
MKTKIFASVVTSLLLLSNLNATEPQVQNQAPIAQQVNYEYEMIKQVIPNTKIRKYKKSVIEGFYNIYLENGQIIYVNPFKSLILFGEIWNSSGNSLTASERDNWQKELSRGGEILSREDSVIAELKKATPENKTWNKELVKQGIKDGNDFIKDNTNPTELKNTVDNKEKIDNGKKELGRKTSDTKETTYNPYSNSGQVKAIENKGEEIRNINVGNPEVKDDVNNHVKKEADVGKNVNENLNANGKVIDGHAQKNANEINSNLGQNVAEALDNGNTNINDLTHAITGKKENVNPEAKRFAEHNEAQNKTTYTNATEGKDKLIETGYFPKSDNINNSKLGKTSTEDLARIHNHDNINNSLNESSKASLQNELEKRGYDFSSNKYSSKYEPSEIKNSIIPNGDKHNPGSDIQNSEQIHKGKNDFSFDFKNTME